VSQAIAPASTIPPSKKSGSRLVVFDLLRGYFLIVILLNHLHYFPSGLEWFTGQSYLYTSTAEGFFLLSGIVLGLVRGAKLIDKPFKVARNLLLQRSVQLYLTSIILVLLFTFAGWLFLGQPGLKYGIFEPTSGSPFELIWQTVTLQYAYGWADFLRMYALFILVSPLALWLLRRGLWYLVLAASFGIWLLYPFSPWPAGELSNQISWQVIFFAGFIIGFHINTITTWWRRLAEHMRRMIIASTVSLAVLTLVINVFLVFGHDIAAIGPWLAEQNIAIGSHFNKDRMPIPRLLLFGLWFAALFFIFTRFEQAITKRLGWLLLPFGTNSLYVYIIESFVAFALLLIMPLPGPWYINLVVSLISIGLVYAAVRTKFLMRVIPR